LDMKEAERHDLFDDGGLRFPSEKKDEE